MNKSKRQQARERQRRKKLRNYLIGGVLGAIVVVVIGSFVWQNARPIAEIGDPVEVSPDYVNHIEEGTNPGPFPSDPPAGGRHYAGEFEAGFYDETSPQAQVTYPEGYIGHNLEHGYAVFWYNCELLSTGECDTLKSKIRTVMDEFGGVKLIAFPWPTLDVPVAMTSWGRILRLEAFDPKTAAEFIRANRNKSPEPNAP